MKDFSAAANEIVAGLRGSYLTPNGVRKQVQGDMQRLHSLDPPLSTLAKKMLHTFQATSRNIEGTGEIRTIMRKDAESFAVMYGGFVFMTITPNERQATVLIRCSRTLRSDPIRKYDKDFAEWTDKDTPSLELEHEHDETCDVNIPLTAILGAVPSMDAQQKLLARDPLASVYGFHIVIRILLRALFGVRICSECPDCNTSKTLPSCCDELGSVASPEGGIAGLVEAYHGSIESQGRTGSLHGHFQLFIARIHQHTKMVDIAKMIQQQGDVLVNQFERFTNHLSKATYNNVVRFNAMQEGVEERHRLDRNAEEGALLVHGPRGAKDAAQSSRAWSKEHQFDSDAVRGTVNHHVCNSTCKKGNDNANVLNKSMTLIPK
jgi:hypothetical protein